MKLKFKLPLILAPLIALPLIIVSGLLYVELRNFAEARSFSQIKSQALQVEAYTDALVSTARANVQMFSEYQMVEQYFLAQNEEERYSVLYRPLQRALAKIQNNYPEYYELRVLLPSGFEDLRMVNINLLNTSEEEGSSSLFKEVAASNDDVVVRFDKNPDNGKLSCYVFRRVKLINHALDDTSTLPTMRGYFAITISVASLAKQLEAIPFGEDGGLFVSNKKGQPVIVPAQLSWIYKHKDFLNQILSQHQDAEFKAIFIDGQKFHLQCKQIQDDLWLHAIISEQELLSTSKTLTKYLATGTGVAIFLCLFLIYYVFNVQIIGPIEKLRKAFLRISDGEDLVQISVLNNDELGELGDEFNQMSLKLKQSNDKIRDMAFNDSLTRLPNRFMFYKNLKRAIEIAEEEQTRLGVLFIDLDNFKQVNDTLGHSVGDKLLQKISLRLQESLRGKDYSSQGYLTTEKYNLSRLGGDEFTVLLNGVSSAIGIGKIAQRLLNAIEAPVLLNDKKLYVTASIGISIFPDDGNTVEDLIKYSDLAMYQAKGCGKSCYEYYSQEISRLAHDRSDLEQRLRIAHAEQAFEVFYQPIFDAKTQKVSSFEALLRWTDAELGYVSPELFIPVTEEIGMIQTLGAWVLSEACHQAKQWSDMGYGEVNMAVNVSAKQIGCREFVEQVQNSLKTHSLPAHCLHLELTESAIIEGSVQVLSTLKKLRDIGACISLDDFGTGYSSLSYLRSLPIDILKIDRSFVQGLAEQNNNILLSSIITMAQALGLKVTAEGIEEQGQFAFLLKEGCDSIQGFLLARPEPQSKITEKLKIGTLLIG